VANVSYPWPIHTMRGYASLGYREGDLPHTERAAREIFSLPMFPSLPEADQAKVIAAISKIVGPAHPADSTRGVAPPAPPRQTGPPTT